MKKIIITVLAVLCPLLAFAENSLVVSFGTTPLNGIEEALVGVLVTPSKEKIKTDLMGPYEHRVISLESFGVGSYQVYFEALSDNCCKVCPFIGGITAVVGDKVLTPLDFPPAESRIQTFRLRAQISEGSTSAPIGTFEITEEHLITE
jgi:hypothetical protein